MNNIIEITTDVAVITALEAKLATVTTMQANREFVADLLGHEARINSHIKSLNLKRDDCAKALAPVIVLRARAEAQLQRLIEAARQAGEFAQAGDNQHSVGGGSATGPTSLNDVGLSKRDADRARVLARAEAADPAAIAKAAEKIVATGRAPTLKAVTEALRPKPAPAAPKPAPVEGELASFMAVDPVVTEPVRKPVVTEPFEGCPYIYPSEILRWKYAKDVKSLLTQVQELIAAREVFENVDALRRAVRENESCPFDEDSIENALMINQGINDNEELFAEVQRAIAELAK